MKLDPWRILRFACAIVLVLTLFHTSVRATEFLVSSAAQISSVMASQAHPGDTLTMVSGTWTNQLIVFQGNGTASLPILLRAQGGYGSVHLNGTSTLRIAGNYLIVDGLTFEGGYSASGSVIEFRNGTSLLSNYSRLTNSAVIDYNPAFDSIDYKWISLYGTHNRVDHCYTTGKTHSGTTLVVWRPTAAADYHRIDHNYFGPRPALGVNGGETVRVGTSDQSLSSSFTTVEYNYFYQCNGEIEIISNKSCDNTYRYNTFVSCVGTLTLRHGNRCLVEGNFFFGNRLSSTGGIRIIGEDHIVINNYVVGTTGDGFRSALSMVDGIVSSPLNGYYQVKRAVVAFNTFIDNDHTFDLGAGNDVDNVLPPLDCTIGNNVTYTTHSPIVALTDTPINLTWQSNIFYGASIGISPVPAGITITDPLLASVGSDGLRHLSGSSPAINSSLGAYPDVVLDMDGQMRDGAKDIGADEYSTSAFTIRPLTANDVGPQAGSFTLTVVQTAHGTIYPGTIATRSGDTQRFSIIPYPGYFIRHIYVDDQIVPDSLASYTFVNVLYPHTITAEFGTTQFTLLTSAKHGTITRNPDAALYDSGSTVQLTAVPDSGYQFAQWSGDASGIDNPYTILIDGDKSVNAEFRSIDTTIRVAVTPGWNQLSVPLPLTDVPIGSVYPGAQIPGYFYSAGYHSVSQLSHATGYWLKFSTYDTISLTGQPLMNDSVDLAVRWNLIGTIAVPVPVENLLSDPPGLVVSQFFGFEVSGYQGYSSVDTLQPGRSYWVKASTNGRLYFSSVSAPPSAGHVIIREDAAEPPDLPVPSVVERTDRKPRVLSLTEWFTNRRP